MQPGLAPTSNFQIMLKLLTIKKRFNGVRSHLGDVRFDAFGQLDARLSKQLGQLVWDVLVLVQSVE